MTAQEIIKALRCISTVHDKEENIDCSGCPYRFVEHLTGDMAKIFGETEESCDIDKIGLDAADMLENMIELGVL